MKAKFLNLGCGSRFHEDWVNIDYLPSDEKVIKCDILAGLPFEEGSFDACYSSHMIEHFSKEDSLLLIKEMFRVLKIGGICRIVVPDFQDCVAEYNKVFKLAMKGEDDADLDYRWMIIEMIDQFTRTTFGGEMMLFIKSAPMNLGYIESRIGAIGGGHPSVALKRPRGLVNRIVSAGWMRILEKLRIDMAKTAVRLFCGRKYAGLFAETVFRASGEVHKSVWDEYSLNKLFKKARFSQVSRCTAFESAIEGFEKYGLDFSLDGKCVFRPHSIHMEAQKK